MKEHATFTVVHRRTGLTHPAAPFMQSSNIIVIDDAAEIAKWQHILGPPGEFNSAIIPCTMLPALSDIDGQLQPTYLEGARLGIEYASPQILAATEAAFRERLHGNLEALADLDEQKVADAIGTQRPLPGKL